MALTFKLSNREKTLFIEWKEFTIYAFSYEKNIRNLKSNLKLGIFLFILYGKNSSIDSNDDFAIYRRLNL